MWLFLVNRFINWNQAPRMFVVSFLGKKYMTEGGFFQSKAEGASQFWKGLHEIKN